MPELPEVEFARRVIAPVLGGAEIVAVSIRDARILEGSARATEAALLGHRVRAVDRRGKWLRLSLDEGRAFSHLGMTGKWVLAEGDEPLRFERLRVDARKARRTRSLRYLDPRLFGRFLVASEDIPAWRELGPDPLLDGVDADALFDALQRRKAPVKVALLDQTLLAGIGNIQATEALFAAQIDPRRPAASLARREVGRLAKAILRSIERTLSLETGPEIAYVEEPGAPNPFVIYGRQGERCPRCRGPLEKITLAGRGTVLCAACQR